MSAAMSSEVENRRVVLGLSGGVDSAVAALLLQDAGADVHALHMTNWEDDDGYCTAAEDLQDARLVCEQLDIPLHHVNFAKQYRDQVFEYFLDEYRAGRTPNPDVLCNREIKFGVFRDYAKRLGGDLLATGHYARSGIADGDGALLKGQDPTRTRATSCTPSAPKRWPKRCFRSANCKRVRSGRLHAIGGCAFTTRKTVPASAFIGERPFREFLSTYLPANPGPIERPMAKRSATHSGLMYYTLGQRQGLQIGGRKRRRRRALVRRGQGHRRTTR